MKIETLFLIPLTPVEMLDKTREALRELCFRQLGKLHSSYRVWLLGDIENWEGLPEHFECISTEGKTKEDKLFEAGKLLEMNTADTFQHLVRLDDDDLINPAVFDANASGGFDCCVDSKHWFYDLSSGLLSRQKRDWFPNTMIHSFAHAMTKVAAIGGSEKAGAENYLFACDHSRAWKSYYENRKIEWVSSGNPLYIRVLNPGSITASAKETAAEDNYRIYLSTFGDWKADFPFENHALKQDLENIWMETSGKLKTYSFPKRTVLTKIIEHIRK